MAAKPMKIGDLVLRRGNRTYRAVVQEVKGDKVKIAVLWYDGDLRWEQWQHMNEWVGPAEQVAVALMEDGR